MAFTQTIRVLLVEDHEMVAVSLKTAFRLIEDIDFIGHASTCDEAIEMIAKLQPDVVLMDSIMSAGDGFQVIKIIRSRFPQVKVIVLSESNLQPDKEAAKQTGADAFVSKTGPVESLFSTIRATV